MYFINHFVISEQLKVDSVIVASARASVLAKQPPSAVFGRLVWCGYTTQCSGAAISTVPPWPKSAKNCQKTIIHFRLINQQKFKCRLPNYQLKSLCYKRVCIHLFFTDF